MRKLDISQLLIATTNPGKVREFQQMLASTGLNLSDLSTFPKIPAIEETGHTFRINACLKAAGYANQFKHWTIADDSGLEVDALDGRPGVHSARWADMHNAGEGDAANNALLLKQLINIPDDLRTARFVCVLALANPDGKIILTTRDTVEGTILRESAGSHGFGYDPLFHITALNQTTAQLPADQKHQVSHRGKALRQLQQMLSQLQ